MSNYYSTKLKGCVLNERDQEVWDSVNAFMALWNDPTTTIQQQTSGSTGTPKLIAIQKEQMIASACMTGDFFKLDQCKNALLCISPDYIGGKMMIVRSLIYELELLVTPPSSNPLKELNIDVDFCAMVPLQVRTILKENPEQLDRIRYLIIGGGAVDEELIQQLQKRSCAAYSTFGMTETVSHVALRKLNSSSSVYQAVGVTTFSEHEQKLIIHAPDLGISSLTTNDIVELDSPTTFRWIGRADSVVNSGGVKLFPEEIEEQLRHALQGVDYFVAGQKDPNLGEQLVFITTNQSIADNDLMQLFQRVLTKYQRPKKIIRLPDFSFTPTGKLQRKETLNRHGIE
jgi:O-succinylbenzoic acid--CoA ligase